jgi:hypothetical protein
MHSWEGHCGGGILKMQGGIRKNLWPKQFPECPVARHFVY